ncbi:uncharacterized protein A4U43_C03F13060 [Asparagus officinalis]|uniref:Sey1/RHD3-like three-helix bundle domain-containing protein n=2 Tax=Asparagus officinalis TaxID=4686 RepID=A0A5P1F9P2_ASPOF|nr:uncharacterized protein A4U43_C03F13060 [Asparagus officinalis]
MSVMGIDLNTLRPEPCVREKLQRDIEAHAVSVRSTKLSELSADCEKQLTEALSEPVESLFYASGIDAWTSITRLYQQEMQKALLGLAISLSGFELDQVFFNEILGNLKDYARNVVEKKSREEASKVLIRMKDR